VVKTFQRATSQRNKLRNGYSKSNILNIRKSNHMEEESKVTGTPMPEDLDNVTSTEFEEDEEVVEASS